MSKYTDRITNYHAGKPKFFAHIDLSTRPLIDVSAAMTGMIQDFDIDTAIGQQLDILGEWIGRKRRVRTPISGVYFSWDTEKLGWDQGVWQGPFDPDDGFLDRKRTARTVLTGMCYSVGSVMRQGSSSLTRLTGQSAMTSRTWRR